jgi:hypothetical protein
MQRFEVGVLCCLIGAHYMIKFGQHAILHFPHDAFLYATSPLPCVPLAPPMPAPSPLIRCVPPLCRARRRITREYFREDSIIRQLLTPHMQFVHTINFVVLFGKVCVPPATCIDRSVRVLNRFLLFSFASVCSKLC